MAAVVTVICSFCGNIVDQYVDEDADSAYVKYVDECYFCEIVYRNV